MVSTFKLQLFTEVGRIYLISLVICYCWSYLLHNFKSNIHTKNQTNLSQSENMKDLKKKKLSGTVCLPERLFVHIATT